MGAQAGFNIIWANDINKFACDTYEMNIGLKPIYTDIRQIKLLPHARNFLYREIFRCLRIVEPDLFVVENVKGLINLYKGEFLRQQLFSVGYC
jgi:DNA (cytosine-5)-methyltransferase 1